MVELPTARDMMTSWRVILSPETDLLDAIEQLVDRHVVGAPVLGEARELLGILTEKDCLRLLSKSVHGELAGGIVGDFMSSIKAVIRVEMDVFAVAQFFLETNFPVLPVLDGEELIGRLSRQDLLGHVERFIREVGYERSHQERDRVARENPSAIGRMQRLAAAASPKQLAELLRNRNN